MIFRVEKVKDYTVMSNYHLKDNNLTLKSKGLLSWILSLPDDWDYSLAGIVKCCKEGETAVKAALKELQKYGYIQIIKHSPNGENNHIHYEYRVFERPCQEGGFLGLENLPIENQSVENHRQINTKKINTKKENKKEKTHTSKLGISANDSFKDVQEIINYYKQTCVNLPQPRVINTDRKKLVRKVLSTYGISTDKEVIDKTANSSFLNGSGSTGWTADFDWIFKEKNFIKILEGNYVDKKSTKSKNKDVFGELNGKVQSITNETDNSAFLEKLRKEGRRVEY